MEKELEPLISGKSKSEKRLEAFKEYCRDNKQYNLTSLNDVMAVYGSFERATKRPKVLDETTEEPPVDLHLDL